MTTEITETKLAKLLTMNEVIDILKVKKYAIYRYIHNGELQAHRLGGNGGKHRNSRKPYRIWESDLLDFINSGKFTLSKQKTGAMTSNTESNNNVENQNG